MTEPKPKNITLVVHPEHNPKQTRERSSSEKDVYLGLAQLGHHVAVLELEHSLVPLEKLIAQQKPDVVFNLLEEFKGEGVFDFHIISYLEAKGIRFTGCNPRGLVVSRNKKWVRDLAAQEGILVPNTELLPQKQMTSFPMFIKFNREHASLGLTQKSRVSSVEQLKKQSKKLRNLLDAEILAQEFIPGKEVSVSVLGHRSPQALAVWELSLNSPQEFATEKIKFDSSFRFKHKIRARQFKDKKIESKLSRISLKLFKKLDLSGYARFDFRLDENNNPYLIDVNANPNLAKSEDFAKAAQIRGYSYTKLLSEILRLAYTYKPRR